MPNIAVINESTVISNADVAKIVNALLVQYNRDLAPIWSLEKAAFHWIPKGHNPAAGAWWLVFLDDSDQAGALAYHDLTNDGLPISKVFVKTLLSDGASVSVGASHEMCEMAVDPTINLAAQDANGTFWAYEVCDPCESDQYGYKIGDILMTDFVTPAWFGFAHAGTRIRDFMGHLTTPFAVGVGGYAQFFDPKKGWQQITGHEARRSGKAHVVNAAKGSRRERRERTTGEWKLSEHRF
jgi:hypothetical protein